MNSLLPAYWILFLGLWRASYEVASIASSKTPLAASTAPINEAASPLQKEWAMKAARRYAEAQDKKWQRWNNAMFERYD